MYGLSKEDYEDMLVFQKHSCAICKRHVETLSYNLLIDHCHNTNVVRGLLCTTCNTGLGYLERFIHTPNLMDAAMEYLTKKGE